ncbi:CIA30 family protein [Gramella sp. GC03-9]|uniref:CIA30 family protein n=1 Tax=Christiangramia oceanisediminis TaxID=2920386 RepID=A0A9X2KZ97_9FLAO|nr:CIA30 family protein [Gramella oceanisediminis]MCP9201110.1 CIA30 family protein [Gramella oceanisediminis]
MIRPSILIAFISLLFVKSIFDFNSETDLSRWKIVEDQVMGGVSTGKFYLNDEGHAVFTGSVSLENNGGFVSVDYDMPKTEIGEYKFVAIRLKGDGKNYQLRVKNDDQVYYSYNYEFRTSGEWEEVQIPLSKMSPTYRGRSLDKPDFNHSHLDQLTFLIGNKKNEDFRLLIDKIELK